MKKLFLIFFAFLAGMTLNAQTGPIVNVDTWCSIKPYNSDKALSLYNLFGSAADAGVAVVVTKSTGDNTQQWKFKKAWDDLYYITGKSNTNLLLTARGGQLYHDAAPYDRNQSRPIPTKEQAWKLTLHRSSQGAAYSFKNEGTENYLSIKDGVVVESKSSSSWQIIYSSNDSPPSGRSLPTDGWYKLTNSGKALTISGSKDGPQITTSNDTREDDQKWRFALAGDRMYYIVPFNNPSNCLDILNNKLTSRRQNNTPSQKWKLVETFMSGFTNKSFYNVGTEKYLHDLVGSSSEDWILKKIVDPPSEPKPDSSLFTRADAVKYAPELRLHPDEKYRPMKPDLFIKNSKLTHNNGASLLDLDNPFDDISYNKIKNKFVGDSKFGDDDWDYYHDIDVAIVNSFKSIDGKHIHPRLRNSAEDAKKIMLQFDNRGNKKPVGHPDPNYNVPVFYDIQEKNTNWIVSYWYFFGFNEGPGIRGIRQNHQGDWEHCTLVFDKTKNLIRIYLTGHGQRRCYRKDEIQFDKKNPTHPIIYIAKGTHASWHRAPCKFETDFKYLEDSADDIIGNWDYTDEKGIKWQTWHNCQSLENQDWRDFAGAWGELGEKLHHIHEKLRGATSGPLGPWLKRQADIDMVNLAECSNDPNPCRTDDPRVPNKECITKELKKKLPANLESTKYFPLLKESTPEPFSVQEVRKMANSHAGKKMKINQLSIFAKEVENRQILLDNYSIEVQLPPDAKPARWIKKMMIDMDGFIGHGLGNNADFKTFGWKNGAVNHVIDIDLKGVSFFGRDIQSTNAPVVITRVNNSSFTVQTLTLNGKKHPLHGTRKFGFEALGNNKYRFYTRAVSVPSNWEARLLAKPGEKDMWSNWLNALQKKIRKLGGRVIPNTKVIKQLEIGTPKEVKRWCQ